jgi:hypothetical protein
MNAFALINHNAASDLSDLAAVLSRPSPIRNRRDALLAETRDAEAEFRADYDSDGMQRQVASEALALTDRLAVAYLAFELQAKAILAELGSLDPLTDRPELFGAHVSESVGIFLTGGLERVFDAYVKQGR